jgi:hypothetical protein
VPRRRPSDYKDRSDYAYDLAEATNAILRNAEVARVASAHIDLGACPPGLRDKYRRLRELATAMSLAASEADVLARSCLDGELEQLPSLGA